MSEIRQIDVHCETFEGCISVFLNLVLFGMLSYFVVVRAESTIQI
jgi:hypothetical protein